MYGPSIHRSSDCMDRSDVWIASVPMYGYLWCMDPPMVANLGIFQVADAPMYCCIFTVPNICNEIILLNGWVWVKRPLYLLNHIESDYLKNATSSFCEEKNLSALYHIAHCLYFNQMYIFYVIHPCTHQPIQLSNPLNTANNFSLIFK